MARSQLRLGELIEEANKKLSSERDALIQIAKQEKYKGTVEEIMQFLDRHNEHFEDSNVEVVKAALESFLNRLSPPALKLTMASIRREMDSYLNKSGNGSGNGSEKEQTGGAVSQDDIDLLLSGAGGDDREETAEEPSSPDSVLSQDDLDALFSPAGDTTPEPVKEAPRKKETMSQDDIESLLSGLPGGTEQNGAESETPADGGTNSTDDTGSGGLVEQADIDSLLNDMLQSGSSDSEVETPREEPEDNGVLDQSSIESLFSSIESDSEKEGPPSEESEDSEPAEQPPEPEESAVEEDSKDLAAPVRDMIPKGPDLTAGDVPLDIEPAPYTEDFSQQSAVDALLEDARKEMNGGECPPPSAAKTEPLPDTRLDPIPAADCSQRSASPQSMGAPPSQIVLEERGEARILGECYRVYAMVDGAFTQLAESETLEEAKQALQEAWMDYPAKHVFLRKVSRKEVLVIKEDLVEVPVRVQAVFDV